MKVEVTIPVKDGHIRIGSMSTTTNIPSGLVGASAVEALGFKIPVRPGHKKSFKLIVDESDLETGITKMRLLLEYRDSLQLGDFGWSILTDRLTVNKELSAVGWKVSFDEVVIKGIEVENEQAKEAKRNANKIKGTFKLFSIKRLLISIGATAFVFLLHYLSGEQWKFFTFFHLGLAWIGSYGSLTIENHISNRRFNKRLQAQ